MKLYFLHVTNYSQKLFYRPIRDIDAIRDLEWSSTNCVIQWSTLGTWGETSDTADPTTAAASRSQELVAVGDNWGRIKLYSSPACQPRTLCHSYTGHSSQVMFIQGAE